MDDWTKYLPSNGQRLSSPSLPQGSLALDSQIEQSGLDAGTLYGSFSSVLGVGKDNGGGYARMDSVNRRLIVHDGSNLRVLIGFKN